MKKPDLQPYIRAMQSIKANSAEAECMQRLFGGTAPEQDRLLAPVHTFSSGESRPCMAELRHVTFGYDRNRPPVIDNVSLCFPAGSLSAVIGAQECGKSTLLRLLCGMLQPWSGEVLLDGRPVSVEGSAAVAAVGFGNTLSAGTIRENLAAFRPDCTEDDIISAAKDACIHDCILAKSGGYGYRVSESGAGLSSGERQKLQIAQALAGGASVLLLDNAVCISDTQTEKRILANIRRRGCTCIITSFRADAVRDCDCIYILENGGIVQQGTHLLLTSMQGNYRKIIRGL